jgi:hypothetical protein
MTTDPYEAYRKHARALVVAEVEDVLTRTDADSQPGPQYTDTARTIAKLPPAEQLSVLVETAAVAGEAIIRLAAARGEDPRATWEWLMSTPWTGAVEVPEGDQDDEGPEVQIANMMGAIEAMKKASDEYDEWARDHCRACKTELTDADAPRIPEIPELRYCQPCSGKLDEAHIDLGAFNERLSEPVAPKPGWRVNVAAAWVELRLGLDTT